MKTRKEKVVVNVEYEISYTTEEGRKYILGVLHGVPSSLTAVGDDGISKADRKKVTVLT